ncbi:uncharacterized protein LAESUDRAFT_709739 [Laetiporus sulphureus 93-53]|uniref:Uncharacterized protein n=1 Tax=Laetiporus sulphureus 93-53 TaxID=1314785 RepID=A0A165I1I6_9APHY|nr:uncharacterized protein LAESUDRAFT_709739 [Laetiporus sulphureus 93-53]KZT12470.1 hypothetical protein LAESUDRAFT_709739 [Laetiporus sulphureus 93-53]
MGSLRKSLLGVSSHLCVEFRRGYWSSQNASWCPRGNRPNAIVNTYCTAFLLLVTGSSTHPSLSDLTNIEIILENLDNTLSPSVSSSVLVHSGSVNEHAETILRAEIKRLTSSKAARPSSTGRTFSGALADLDALFFTLNLVSNIHVASGTFGTHRVGSGYYTHIQQKEPDPHCAWSALGFHQLQMEIHVMDKSDNHCLVACLGNEKNAFSPPSRSSDILGHLGPYYDDIYIGTIHCT